MLRIPDPQDVRRRNRSCVNPGIEYAPKFPAADHQGGKICQVPARETLLAQLIASDLSLPINTSRSTTNPLRKKCRVNWLKQRPRVASRSIHQPKISILEKSFDKRTHRAHGNSIFHRAQESDCPAAKADAYRPPK